MDCQSKEITVFGEYSVEAQIGKDKFRERVLVTKLEKCLLGNSFITKMKNFDWNNFLTTSSELQCNQINDTKANLEELKKEYEEIFKENPQSKEKGKLAHLVLKKDAVPKFLPARTVPIAIEKQVEWYNNKMVQQRYWTPVSQSKWAFLYQCLKKTEVLEFVVILSQQLILKVKWHTIRYLQWS